MGSSNSLFGSRNSRRMSASEGSGSGNNSNNNERRQQSRYLLRSRRAANDGSREGERSGGNNADEQGPRALEPERAQRSDDELDISLVLQWLLQGNIQSIFSSGETRHRIFADSDSSSDDSGDYEPEYNRVAGQPPVANNPDTTGIDKSELKQEILSSLGAQKLWNMPRSSFLPTALRQREEGSIPCHPSFSYGDRCSINSNYLPNYKVSMTDLPMFQYDSKVFCGQFNQHGNMFITAAQDQKIRVYEVSDGAFREIKNIRGRDVGWSILDTALSPDGHYIIYSSWSEYVHLCNVYGDDDTHVALYLDPDDRQFCIFSVMFSQDNTEILGGSNDGNIYVYDRGANRRSLKIDAHEDDVNSVTFGDMSSNLVYSGADDGLCKVWDRRTLRENSPKPVGVLAGHQDGITFIDSKNDGRYLLTNSKDQTIKLWDIRRFSDSRAQEATRRAVASQRWDYRWQTVPRRVKNKAITGDSSLMTFQGHSVLHTLVRAYFSPYHTTAQQYIYSGCATGSIIIYDILTGHIVGKLEGHRGCVRDVAWHPYENYMMSSSWDHTVSEWVYNRRMANAYELDDSSDDWSGTYRDGGDDSNRGQKLRRSNRTRQQAKPMYHVRFN